MLISLCFSVIAEENSRKCENNTIATFSTKEIQKVEAVKVSEGPDNS